MGWGDDLMAAGHARELQKSDSRRVRIMHGGKVPWSPIWDHNPRLARPDERGDFQLFFARSQATNMRGYHRAKSETKWTYDLSYRAPVGEIYFTRSELAFAALHSVDIVVEPNIKKNASPNKNWGWQNWLRFAELARAAGLKLAQFAYPGAAILPSAQAIQTPTFRHGAAVLSGARGVVTHEGGVHHCAAALSIPGVVVFGNFTPVELTGFPIHRNIGASLEQACGMRVPCKCCEKAMSEISPEIVLQQLREVLECPKPTNQI